MGKLTSENTTIDAPSKTIVVCIARIRRGACHNKVSSLVGGPILLYRCIIFSSAHTCHTLATLPPLPLMPRHLEENRPQPSRTTGRIHLAKSLPVGSRRPTAWPLSPAAFTDTIYEVSHRCSRGRGYSTCAGDI